MNIPKKIKIGNADYKVELTNKKIILDGEECKGIIDFDFHTIKIDTSKQDKHNQEETFLHEVLHGIIKERDIDISDEQEEIICDAMSKGLHQILKDNQTVFKPINVSIDFPISVCKEVEDAIKGLHNKTYF